MKLDEFLVFKQDGSTLGNDNDFDRALKVVTQAAAEVFRVSEPFRKPTELGGVLRIFCNTVDNPDLQDGKFIVKDSKTGEESIDYFVEGDDYGESIIGTVPEASYGTFCDEAYENAYRLLVSYDTAQDHTSWQSRNKRNGTGVGAIITKPLVLSFAGCDQMTNEMLVVCTALVTGLYNEVDASYVTAITGNELVDKVMEAMRSVCA